MSWVSRCASFAWALAIASPAPAEGVREIPRSNQANGGYVSTQLLLKPCLDIRTLVSEFDDGFLRDVGEARKALPPGTCDNPLLVDKLFTARFLQYASLVMVNDPWNLGARITAQNQTIHQCKDTRCVEHELDAVIAALSPVYLEAQPVWPRGTGLCTTKPVDLPASKALARLHADTRKELVDSCGERALMMQTCSSPHGKLLFASCVMEGNQVNAPEWLYRVKGSRFEPLFVTSDGPSGVLESTCNGMPDLMTAARVSMGEHQHTYYRYDGKQYQSVYAYSAIGVGADSSSNDLVIAQGGPDANVVCR